MADQEDDFDKAFEGFGEPPKQPDPPADDTKPVVPPVEEDKPKEGESDADKNKPTDKPDDATKPADPKPPAPEGDKPDSEDKDDTDEKAKTGDENKSEDAPDEPKPLTKDDLKSTISDIRNEERTSTREIQEQTNEVLEAYYPNGLSNVLTTPEGKELKTPQDVVDASNGEMSIEEATKWLMNEQYKMDTEIDKIKNDAEKIAETTINFKRDSVAAVQKYEPLFKQYPILQTKVFDLMMKQVKADEKKNVILSAPDVIDLYDTYLEPYQKAFEYGQGKPATNPEPKAPEAPKPSADDRLDEGGDGGSGGDSDDPNNFAQQVTKELAKGF